MKAKELMTGDLVAQKHGGLLLKVSEVRPPYIIADGEDGQFHEDTLEPIPLTPELLERHGFVLQKESSIAKEYICARGGGPDHNLFVTVFKNRDFVKVYYCPIDASTMIDVNIPHCTVHQLQHALRLCDIDKEIIIKEG